MSFGPVPATNIQLSVAANANVFFTLAAQAAWAQTATITDSNNNTIAALSGTANPGFVGTTYFNSGGNTTLYLTVSTQQGGTSQAIYADSVLNIGATVYAGYYIFATEDGGGTDYNDSLITLAWTAYSG